MYLNNDQVKKDQSIIVVFFFDSTHFFNFLLAMYIYLRGREVFIVNLYISAEWIIFFKKRVLFEWFRDR